MSVKLNSYINFNGNAREAMDFYRSIFGGQIYSDSFGEFAVKNPDSGIPVAEADRDKIMHSQLMTDNGIVLMASDVPTGMPYTDGARISLCLSGEDETLLRSYWDTLSQGGQVTMPLDKAPWGDVFGMLTDKFGVAWMVNIGPDQPTA